MNKAIKILLITAILLINAICHAETNEAEDIFERATLLFNEQKYQEALEDFNKALQLGYAEEPLYEMRAMTYLNLNEVDKTIDDCNHLLEINLRNVAAYHIRGSAYLLMNDYESAIEDFKTSLMIEPNDETVQSFLKEVEQLKSIRDKDTSLQEKDFLTIGYDHFKAKRYNKAIEYFTRVLEINPDNTAALKIRGGAYAATNQIDKAISDWEHELKLIPDDEIVKGWLQKARNAKK